MHDTQGFKETAHREDMHCHTSLLAEPLRKICLKSVTLKSVRMGSAPYAFLPLGTEGVAGRGDSGAQVSFVPRGDSGAQVSFAERRSGVGAGTGMQGLYG